MSDIPTPSLRLSFAADVQAADAEARTITGRIVGFAPEVGNTSVGPVSFAPGSIHFAEAGSVKLFEDHSNKNVLGRAASIWSDDTGMYATFSVANTSAGTDALVLASQGLKSGLSVGVDVKASKPTNGVLLVTASTLREVSLVEAPAFASAAVERVAASEHPDEAETSTEGETEMTEQVVQVEETTAPAVEASAAPQVQAAAPIFTSPRLEPLTASSYMRHKINAALGDYDSMMVIRAADDSTATNTGLTGPYQLPGFVVNTFASRPTIDACGGAMALPESGMSFTLPRLTAAPTVADTNEGAAPSETGMTSDYITINVNKFAGLNRVSFELWERSNPMFETLLMAELQKAYSKATDAAVIAALTSGGTQATNVAGTIAGLQSFVATEGPAAYVATGGDFATELVASSAWWTALLSANDTADRPIFSALAPQNAGGDVAVTRAAGTVFGTNFWVDHNIATVGLIDESAFLIAPDAVGIWETPTTSLRVNVLTTGEIEVSLHGYLAVSVLKAGGVRRFNLT